MRLDPRLVSAFHDNSGKTAIRGEYNPMQFILRLRPDIHHTLNSVVDGVQTSGTLTDVQAQAFSTYLHETIHWWQHVGSTFGMISSLKFPVQNHLTHSDLVALLDKHGAFKSIAQFDKITRNDELVNKILNNWHDIEFAGQIAFDPNRLNTITRNPYFECWGHSYEMMWGGALWTLAATFDRDFAFLPKIKKWEEGFGALRNAKVESFYYGSSNRIPPLGTRAIFEGQARLSQLQYLSRVPGNCLTSNDFAQAGMLQGFYVEALQLFLDILGESMPLNMEAPLIGLFLLVCDISINPTDGFPFDITHYESFLITNDPGYRFCLICQMIRDKYPELKHAIREYSREEYISISEKLASSISCFSPFESAAYIHHLVDTEENIKQLLKEEVAYKYTDENLPIRLFFSKFLRFQLDKVYYPQAFCWPGMNFVGFPGNTVELDVMHQLFERHKALFINDDKNDIYHSAIPGYTADQVDETLNRFFTWNSVYDMVRQWIIKDGPFTFNYQWLSSKHTKEELINWATSNFMASYGVDPKSFKVLL